MIGEVLKLFLLVERYKEFNQLLIIYVYLWIIITRNKEKQENIPYLL